jgi:hypothetical protein
MEKYLAVYASVRYWEDTELNGTEDESAKISCKVNDRWCPIIEL